MSKKNPSSLVTKSCLIEAASFYTNTSEEVRLRGQIYVPAGQKWFQLKITSSLSPKRGSSRQPAYTTPVPFLVCTDHVLLRRSSWVDVRYHVRYLACCLVYGTDTAEKLLPSFTSAHFKLLSNHPRKGGEKGWNSSTALRIYFVGVLF